MSYRSFLVPCQMGLRLIILPLVNHPHARLHQFVIHAVPDFRGVLPLIDRRHNAGRHLIVPHNLLLSAGPAVQNAVAEGAQQLKLGAGIRQSPRRNAGGREIAAAVVIFL